ncbi:MAG: hypothetical protein ACOYJ1_01600 [Peptococcales bacterium]
MAFFKDIGKKIGSAAGATATKAKDLAEITKLNSKISDQEKQIEKLYKEIGEKIFELDKANPESPVNELCAKVISAQQTITELKLKIEEIKNTKDAEEMEK